MAVLRQRLRLDREREDGVPASDQADRVHRLVLDGGRRRLAGRAWADAGAGGGVMSTSDINLKDVLGLAHVQERRIFALVANTHSRR
jgi:hypothetical protein